MRFRIDPMKMEPVFQQLVEQIMHAIACGQLRKGDKLPTVREMAAELMVNPNTVQKAYQELMREGLIFSRKGMGNFISPFGSSQQRALRAPRIEKLLNLLFTEAKLSGLSSSELEAKLKEMFNQNQEKKHEPSSD